MGGTLITTGSARRSSTANEYGVSEFGVTKAVSSGVNTRAMLLTVLNGPLYCGLFLSMLNAYMVW
ncbi:hypothetical protein D3C87_1875070 [compost metagenome]